MAIPPAFNDLNKKAKDLLSKKYDFRNEAKHIRKASNGIKVEYGGSKVKGLDTYVKGTYKSKSLESEGEIHSDASPSSTKAKVKFPGVVAGADVSLTVTSAPDYTVEAVYKRDRVSTLLNLKHGSKGTILGINAAFSVASGLNAGVSTSVDVVAGSAKDTNVAVEFTQGAAQIGVKSSKAFSNYDFSAHYKVQSDLSVGGSCGININDLSPCLKAGLDHKFNSNCDVKARIDSCGVIGAAVEHRLSNPAVKFGMSAEFDATNNFASKKFGAAATFGDY